MTQPMPPEIAALLAGAAGPPAPEEEVLPVPEELPPVAPPAPLPENAPLPPPAGLPPEVAPAAPADVVPIDQAPSLSEMDDDRPAPQEVNYSWAECCSTCNNFLSPEGCGVVNGHVRSDGICDLFDLNLGLPEDAVHGDTF